MCSKNIVSKINLSSSVDFNTLKVDDEACLLVKGLESWIKGMGTNGSTFVDKETGVKYKIEIIENE